MTSKELTLHNKNIKQEVDIELTFTLEIKIQKEHFLAKYQQFFNCWRVSFQTILGWGKKYVYHKSRAEKQNIYLNNKNVKQETGIELIFTLKTRIQN